MVNIKTVYFFWLFFVSVNTLAQYTTLELEPIPSPVSNNAVTEFLNQTEKIVYSFGGIDSSKHASGIHNNCFKYNATFDTWTTLPDLPTSPTRIAAGASTINDTIYIIGGYHVFANGNEQSSNLVHRFHASADTFLTNGTPIPLAIDDHVQAVYKDSLIFIVTGWSHTSNVPNVQIYNPHLDSWLTGTPVPNSHDYKSFGASGTIIGDTLYYFGGARMGGNFPIQNQLRKGYINPNDVTELTWSIDTINPDLFGYRMAVSSYENTIRWVGGSNATYNYNGIGYAGGIPVEPNRRILTFYPLTNSWDTISIPEINMDLRGIANFGCQMILVGGMDANQKVSSKTIQIDCLPNSAKERKHKTTVQLYPNPTSSVLQLPYSGKSYEWVIYNTSGKRISYGLTNGNPINIQTIPNGMYFIHLQTNDQPIIQKLIIRH